jgi:putative nucleotidyltransferase with HDIG domain
MKKKIKVDQLRLDMFVHEFCGTWMEHPFWRARFALRSADDLARVRASGVTEVWIDTDKGLDIVGGQSVEEVAEAVERELAFAASMPMVFDTAADSEAGLARAAALYRRSIPKIATLFTEARLGGLVDVQGCESLVAEISDSVMRDPGALISLVRLKRRDEYTYMHSVAVCALMVSLARHLGLPAAQVRVAGVAGLLHDLGKALMPLEILNKPGKLTDDEFAMMKTHPERGHELLVQQDQGDDVVRDVCLHHHEKVDGSGYPHRLRGDQLTLFAKMGAVCDVYDAVTSLRTYKDAWDPGEALRRMAQWKGHFDVPVFQAFVKTVGIYPVGALVRLQSGRLAVVTAQNPHALLTPKVKAFFSTKSNMRIEPQEIDLSSHWCKDKVVACESPSKWPFKDLDLLWNSSPH